MDELILLDILTDIKYKREKSEYFWCNSIIYKAYRAIEYTENSNEPSYVKREKKAKILSEVFRGICISYSSNMNTILSHMKYCTHPITTRDICAN